MKLAYKKYKPRNYKRFPKWAKTNYQRDGITNALRAYQAKKYGWRYNY